MVFENRVLADGLPLGVHFNDAALQRVIVDLLSDHTELFKQFSDNPSFKKWLADTTFGVTYQDTR
ncbi:hypothetical protein [Ectothiorhodospira marina]|uniref:Type I restriction enzyme, R subunit n=1 Tax=Ectothiorhodospira marina TaxID=1396821 RepID=A0A1H7GC89_9GAMM|nr:hypothetical protein [Ectothiorhodospira marina]SEK34442.1 type I restriction enzyme, R subunit [Ectothiorhodospira marina]